MNAIQQKRWLVDAALWCGLLVCFFLDLTGVALHQWIGVALGVGAAYHLITHWAWVVAVAGRFFGKTGGQARWFALIDAVLLAGFVTMIGTGLVISTWLDLSLTGYAAWRWVHVASSLSTLLVLVLKLGLHARWIISVGRKQFSSRPAPLALDDERRAFIKLMGVVGAASLFAMGSSAASLWEPLGAEASASQGASTAASTANTSTSSGASSASSSSSSSNLSSSCAVQCRRRCAYPGHCRRYVDSDGSGRCDLGECQG